MQERTVLSCAHYSQVPSTHATAILLTSGSVPFFFFSSKRLCRAHAQRNEAKGSFAKIVGKKEHLLHIYLQLYLHELFHTFRCQTVTSKQSSWITCKESKNTYIKIIPDRSLDLNCNL